MALLRQTYGSQKVIQRLSIGRGSAGDLLSLGHTVEVTKSICDFYHPRILAKNVLEIEYTQ